MSCWYGISYRNKSFADGQNIISDSVSSIFLETDAVCGEPEGVYRMSSKDASNRLERVGYSKRFCHAFFEEWRTVITSEQKSILLRTNDFRYKKLPDGFINWLNGISLDQVSDTLGMWLSNRDLNEFDHTLVELLQNNEEFNYSPAGQFFDERSLLYLALQIPSEDESVVLDVSQLIDGGYYKTGKVINNSFIEEVLIHDKRGTTAMTLSKPNIFLSYCWKDEKVVNHIDNLFILRGYTLSRDKREVSYKKSFKEFMKSIRESDFSLIVISDEYLKSRNCMFEVNEFIKDPSYSNRILPLVISGAKFSNAMERSQYIHYWQCELDKIKQQSVKIEQLNQQDLIAEMRQVEAITRNISDFLAHVSEHQYISLTSTPSATEISLVIDFIEGNNQGNGTLEDERYLILNIPESQHYKIMEWWKKDDKGYTRYTNEARCFTYEEIKERFISSEIAETWDCKKFLAIPINSIVRGFNQTYIPFHYDFISKIKSKIDLTFGNKALYLSKEEMEMFS